MSPGLVAVAGTGVGSLTAAVLLARRGWDVAVPPAPPVPRPTLVLNEVALALLADVWGPEVTAGAHPITHRRVRWGAEPEVVVAVNAVAIDGLTLVDRLLARVRPAEPGIPDWVIQGLRGPNAVTGTTESTAAGRRVEFGRRCVLQAEVPLDGTEATITTVPDGWIHTAPVGGGRGIVQCMVPARPHDPDATMARMTAVGGWGPVSVFPAAPALTEPPCAMGRISVADGAVRLDPLSGLGTAWALREGILAAAVVDAIDRGMAPGPCLDHYEARLREALYDHVGQCLRLYSAAFASSASSASSPAWPTEIAGMAEALASERQRHPPASFGLRLNGLHLEPQTTAAR